MLGKTKISKSRTTSTSTTVARRLEGDVLFLAMFMQVSILVEQPLGYLKAGTGLAKHCLAEERYSEAEKEFRETAQERQILPGADDRDTLESKNWLGPAINVKRDMDWRIDKATTLLEHVIMVLKSWQGPDSQHWHSSTSSQTKPTYRSRKRYAGTHPLTSCQGLARRYGRLYAAA